MSGGTKKTPWRKNQKEENEVVRRELRHTAALDEWEDECVTNDAVKVTKGGHLHRTYDKA